MVSEKTPDADTTDKKTPKEDHEEQETVANLQSLDMIPEDISREELKEHEVVKLPAASAQFTMEDIPERSIGLIAKSAELSPNFGPLAELESKQRQIMEKEVQK